MEQLVELAGVDPRDGLLARDEVLIGHLDRDPERRLRGALAGSRLEDEQRAVLDRELDVLHLPVVPLEPVERVDEPCVGVGEQLAHALDRLGGPDARDDVLALGVDEELAEERALAGRGVAREAHARARRVALVAEDHLDDVHRRAEVVRDVVGAPIDPSARRLPRVEHRAGRALQLLARVLRKRRARLALVDLLERRDQLAEVVGGQLDVLPHAATLLEALQLAFEEMPIDTVDDLAVHLDQPAIGVAREARVPGGGGEPVHRDVVQAEVEDRVHHPGHRDRRARADRHEERVAGIAEPLPGALLEPPRRARPSPARAPPAASPVRIVSRQASVVTVNPAGTGIPSAVISARPTPFPPSSSRPPGACSSNA